MITTPRLYDDVDPDELRAELAREVIAEASRVTLTDDARELNFDDDEGE
jgi:hypothetical protein